MANIQEGMKAHISLQIKYKAGCDSRNYLDFVKTFESKGAGVILEKAPFTIASVVEGNHYVCTYKFVAHNECNSTTEAMLQTIMMTLKASYPEEIQWIDEESIKTFSSTEMTLACPIPNCPECNSAMKLREGINGKFWGCTKFPECKGSRNL